MTEPIEPGLPAMLILPGIKRVGMLYDEDGLLDRLSASRYAQRVGYRPEVMDVSGESGYCSAQVMVAWNKFRSNQNIKGLYGFSGGGYNVRHLLDRLTRAEKDRLELVIIVGAPAPDGVSEVAWRTCFTGPWTLIYRLDPPNGHMEGPRQLLGSCECCPPGNE
jgi:hypothetical protein